jgi:hypothetical protein
MTTPSTTPNPPTPPTPSTPPTPPPAPDQPNAAAAQPGPLDPATLKSAFNAFKKRWKLTRLNDESKLGGGRPTTSGRSSGIAGIQPPTEFPKETWAELARQGRIKDMKGGFYAMP